MAEKKVTVKRKLPFSVVSSSVTTGYSSEISSSFSPGYDIVDYHKDSYGHFDDAPMQGPFTNEHVGGNQHRHAPLNDGTDDILNRAEAFHINLDTAGEIRVYGPDVHSSDAPRASLLRGNSARSPVNIRNIQSVTSSNVLGNYTHKHEVFNTGGRSINNKYFVEQEGVGFPVKTTDYVSGAAADRELPDRSAFKGVFVNRFNAPGGTDVSPRGKLDPVSEEYAPNNSLNTRNYAVRKDLNNKYQIHTNQFGYSSDDTGSANYHKVNRNTLKTKSGSVNIEKYDNWFVQRAIPRNDISYAWITASAVTTPYELGGYQRSGSATNRGGAYTDIQYASSSYVVSGGTVYEQDHIGINVIDKDDIVIGGLTPLFDRDNKYLVFNGTSDYVDLSDYSGELGRSVSMFAWVQPENTGSTDELKEGIFSVNSSGGGNRICLHTRFDAASSLRYFNIFDSQGVLSSRNSEMTPTVPIYKGRWYFVGFVYDRDAGKISVYVDGELQGSTISHEFTGFESTYLFTIGQEYDSGPTAGDYFSGSMDEISIWNKALSSAEVKNLYLKSRVVNSRPRDIREHRVDKEIGSCFAWYTGKTFNGKLQDFLGEKHATLSGVISNQPLEGVITYSTYFNGPYGNASWKQLRMSDHPVVRNMKKNNIISVMRPAQEKIIDNGTRRLSVKSKRSGETDYYIEPPVSVNKPSVHNVMLKGTTDPLAGHRIKHTYDNNVNYFANESLQRVLNPEKLDEQVGDRINRLVNDPDIPENENPVNKVLSERHTQLIFPKPENAFLGKTRSRQEYIIDKPGFDEDGYDRLFGTQRAFWRDNIADRQRTPGVTGALNSQGWGFVSSSFRPTWSGFEACKVDVTSSVSDFNNGDTSIFPFDTRDDYKYASYMSASYSSPTATPGEAVCVIKQNSGGELNYQEFYCFRYGFTGSSETSSFTSHVSVIPKEVSIRDKIDQALSAQLSQKPRNMYVASIPSWYYNTTSSIFESTPEVFTIRSSLDSGLQYRTVELAGKGPWYDSYSDYALDVRVLSKEKSYIPEYSISHDMKSYIVENDGNFRATKRIDTLNSTELKIRKASSMKNISIKCSGVKKLLPFNGFYPAQRTTQLSTIFSQSIAEHILGGIFNNDSGFYTSSFWSIGIDQVESCKMLALLNPFYMPGIMYNSIKSGLAVNWPTYTGSFPEISYATVPLRWSVKFPTETSSVGNFAMKYHYSEAANYSMPFEAIIFPTLGVQKVDYSNAIIEPLYTGFDNPVIAKSLFFSVPRSINYLSSDACGAFFAWNHERDLRYELAASNFFAEVPRFFLKEEKLVSLVSKPSSQWKVFDSNKTYYMDIVLKKSPELVMIESFKGQYHETGAFGQGMTGRYFGYPSSISSSVQSIYADYEASATASMPGQNNDPAYAPYTPPYHEGEAIARVSFTPTQTAAYTLSEVFANLQVENVFSGLERYTGSAAHSGAMPVDASVNYFGKVVKPNIDFNATTTNFNKNFSIRTVRDEYSSNNEQWVISPRWECPVLDFSNQEANVTCSTLDVSVDYIDVTATGSNDFLALPDFSGSGYGRGMWSGYGEIPTGSKGIFLELRESYPDKIKDFVNSTTGSLIEQVGFKPEAKKIGELADNKVISEAIIAIPFLDKPSALTTEIECNNFFKIDREIFNIQRQNIQNGDAAIKSGDFGSEIEYRSTSISKMIELMQNYVIPPNFNFLEYDDINPFVIYFFEFRSTLDKQDLADIWQGVMPKPAMRAELDEVEFSHPAGKFEFFGGNNLPDGVRFMIFKVKKKAEKNYFAVTADSTDDDRFKFDFQVGRKEPEYSYNWPYDFFSLVETANIEATVEYADTKEIDVEKLAQSSPATLRGLTSESSQKVKKRASKKKFNR